MEKNSHWENKLAPNLKRDKLNIEEEYGIDAIITNLTINLPPSELPFIEPVNDD